MTKLQPREKFHYLALLNEATEYIRIYWCILEYIGVY